MFKKIVTVFMACLLLAAFAPWSGAAQWKAPADKPGKAKVVMLVEPSLEFDEVGRFEGGFAEVVKDGKDGVVDRNGKMILPLKYDAVWLLSEKFIRVEKDGKVGVIDISGKNILPIEFERVYVYNDEIFCVTKDKKNGYYDTSGNQIIPHEYEGTSGAISDTLIFAKKEGKWGAIDKRGKTIIPFVFDSYFDVWPRRYGLNAINVRGKWGLVSDEGKEILPPTYDDIRVFREGLAAVTLDGKSGFIDTSGKLAFPMIPYPIATHFKEGMAAILDENEKMGFIDTSGKVVIPCVYERIDYYYRIYEFQHGIAAVKKDGACFYLDKKGNVVSKKYAYATPIGEGMFLVKDFNGKAGYVDATGKEVIPCQYELVDFEYMSGSQCYFHNGLAAVIKDGRWGVIDTSGKVVLPLEYDEISGFDDFGDSGVAWCKKDGKYGIIQFVR